MAVFAPVFTNVASCCMVFFYSITAMGPPLRGLSKFRGEHF